jgi:ATPase subunit of ABC transporter with duplicated ATPase domains
VYRKEDVDPGIKRCLAARQELREAENEGTLRVLAMLTVSQLSKSFAGRALFDDVSLQINQGDRIGLVGPNSAGKSTLFALLLGDVSPDNGTIAIEKNATIGFLPQGTAAAGFKTINDHG